MKSQYKHPSPSESSSSLFLFYPLRREEILHKNMTKVPSFWLWPRVWICVEMKAHISGQHNKVHLKGWRAYRALSATSTERQLCRPGSPACLWKSFLYVPIKGSRFNSLANSREMSVCVRGVGGVWKYLFATVATTGAVEALLHLR